MPFERKQRQPLSNYGEFVENNVRIIHNILHIFVAIEYYVTLSLNVLRTSNVFGHYSLVQNANMLWIEIDCSKEFNKTFSLCFWQLFENNKERNYVAYIVNMYLTYKKASLLLIQSFSKLFMWHKKTTFLLYLCWWEILYFCWNIFFCVVFCRHQILLGGIETNRKCFKFHKIDDGAENNHLSALL